MGANLCRSSKNMEESDALGSSCLLERDVLNDFLQTIRDHRSSERRDSHGASTTSSHTRTARKRRRSFIGQSTRSSHATRWASDYGSTRGSYASEELSCYKLRSSISSDNHVRFRDLFGHVMKPFKEGQMESMDAQIPTPTTDPSCGYDSGTSNGMKYTEQLKEFQVLARQQEETIKHLVGVLETKAQHYGEDSDRFLAGAYGYQLSSDKQQIIAGHVHQLILASSKTATALLRVIDPKTANQLTLRSITEGLGAHIVEANSPHCDSALPGLHHQVLQVIWQHVLERRSVQQPNGDIQQLEAEYYKQLWYIPHHFWYSYLEDDLAAMENILRIMQKVYRVCLEKLIAEDVESKALMYAVARVILGLIGKEVALRGAEQHQLMSDVVAAVKAAYFCLFTAGSCHPWLRFSFSGAAISTPSTSSPSQIQPLCHQVVADVKVEEGQGHLRSPAVLLTLGPGVVMCFPDHVMKNRQLQNDASLVVVKEQVVALRGERKAGDRQSRGLKTRSVQ